MNGETKLKNPGASSWEGDTVDNENEWRVWVCGALKPDGKDCGDLIIGQDAEKITHLRAMHPGLYGGLFLPYHGAPEI